MSLQKRFKTRYPKANFSDFKTKDIFGKPNIFFRSEAGVNKAGDEEDSCVWWRWKRFQIEYLLLKRDEEGNLVSLQVSLLNWLTIQTPS